MPLRVMGTVQIETELADGRVFADSDLTIAINAFPFEVDGQRKAFAGIASQAVVDDATNYVYISHDGDLEISQSGWPTTAHIRLARVIAAAGIITQIINERVFLGGALDRQVNYNSEEGESSTTSAVWQEKLSLTTPDLPAGVYHIQWYAEVRHSDSDITHYTEVRCRADDTIEMGYAAWPFPAHDDFGGFRIVELGGGVHMLDMDWRMQGAGTAYIRRARLFIWRIQ